MSALSWLNDLMTWLARWVPRLVLIKPERVGVRFGRNGSMDVKTPGLAWYWPITQDLTIVSMRLRSLELPCQVHGREVVQLVAQWRIEDALRAVTVSEHVKGTLEDSLQAALGVAYTKVIDSRALADAVLAAIAEPASQIGVRVVSVAVSQRGTVRTIKMLKDWASKHDAAEFA